VWHAPDYHEQALEADDMLMGGDVLPDFEIRLGDLFLAENNAT